MATATLPGRSVEHSAPANVSRDRYLSRAQTAELLGLQPQTLARWAMTGEGPPFVKINARLVRYRESAVVAYLQSCEHRGSNG